MNHSPVSMQTAINGEQRGERDTRLQGRRLVLAKFFWGVIAFVNLGMFAVSLPGFITRLQTPCTSLCASPWQLSTDAVKTLQQAGLSLEDHVTFNLAVMFISTMLSYTIAALLVWRRSNDWMALLVSLMLFGVPSLIFPALGQNGSLFSAVGNTLAHALLALIPISFGVAILRYRLYDIDILINRTLVYLTLTATLALIYLGSIISLQSLLRGIINADNDVAIVGSTLAIAALFQPLRHRIQAIIDRRFYRRKYDAARTLAAFSATLRNEVDLDQLREELVAVVQETMQPSHVSLWVHPTVQDRKHQETWISTPPAS